MRINEITSGSLAATILYHGGTKRIAQFNIPPYGVFFTPHKNHAAKYGRVITPVKVNATNVYLVDFDQDIDEDIIDALFSRDYETLAQFVRMLSEQGYDALQTVSDSEMVCVFPGTAIQVVDLLKE